MAGETWMFNVIFGVHTHVFTHALHDKIVGHPIVCHLVSEERELVFDMALNMVASKNIPTSSKREKPLTISNIKQIYNMDPQDNKVVRGPRSEMQQLLKLLVDDHYVSRYIVCEDKVTV